VADGPVQFLWNTNRRPLPIDKAVRFAAIVVADDGDASVAMTSVLVSVFLTFEKAKVLA
jgi:hypothetical protein